MKKLLLTILFTLATIALFIEPHHTWTHVQYAQNITCATGTTCAVTVASTGSNNVLVAGFWTGSGTNVTISSVTAAACAVSWVHCTNCHVLDGTSGNEVDISYCTKSVSGQTSITVTLSASNGGSKVAIWEESGSLGTLAIDGGATPSNSIDDTSTCTTCAAPTLTVDSNNQVMIVVSSASSGTALGTNAGCSTTGGWVVDSSNGGNVQGHLLNVTSFTAFNICQTSTSTGVVAADISFQETSGAAAPSGINKQRKIEQLEGI